MSKFVSHVAPADQGKRTKALARAMQTLYAAQLAEALMGGKVPEADEKMRAYAKEKGLKKVPEPVVAVMMKALGKVDADQRQKMAETLLSIDPETGKPRSKAEAEELRRVVDPKNSGHVFEKLGMKETIHRIWFPEFKEGNDLKSKGLWVDAVFRDGFPGVVWPWSEDGDPDDSDDDGSGDGSGNGSGDSDGDGAPAPTVPFPSWASILRFRVESVRCIETTREAGRDEIAFDGIAGHGAEIQSSAQFSTGLEALQLQDIGQFRRGDEYTFAPTLSFASWSLHDKAMPHMFSVIFAMAELDLGGGFAGFMSDLMISVTAEIDNMTAEILGIALGTFVPWGFVMTVVAGPIGAIINGAMLVFVLAVGLITGNRDDVFEVQYMALVAHPGAFTGPPFNGTSRTPTETARIPGHGGIYDVSYHWDLI